MKTYIVIGASTGIGKEITRQLVASNQRLIGTYYNDPVEIDQPGLEYHYMNVMDEELNFDFLPDSIDGLVYCPGSIKLRPFSRIKPNQFEADFQLQVLGAIK